MHNDNNMLLMMNLNYLSVLSTQMIPKRNNVEPRRRPKLIEKDYVRLYYEC